MTLLSVIVPTHNRSRYALEAINSLLKLSEKIQIVICDSSPLDEISKHLPAGLCSSRLKMVRTEENISVVDNFNLGLDAADGEYLVFIGDDDFISEEIIQVAEWALINDVESLKFNFPALYYWDDYRHASRGDIYAGTLHIAPFTGGVYAHDFKKSIAVALNNFGGGVFDMPRAYAGMISAQLAQRIKKKYGTLFGGVSPDIYSSLLIASEAISCVIVDYPIIVPGASGGSTTGQSNSGGHYGRLRDNAHIAPFRTLLWDNRIPEFYAVPTVWSYSLLKAVEKVEVVKGEHLRPNFSRLLVKCFFYYPKSYRENLFSLKSQLSELGFMRVSVDFVKAIVGEFFWGISRITKRFKARHVDKNIDVFSNLPTSSVASSRLGIYLQEQGVRLKIPS
ncbi:glycosyltransferase family 2 protein [Pseudomonas gingeri]